MNYASIDTSQLIFRRLFLMNSGSTHHPSSAGEWSHRGDGHPLLIRNYPKAFADACNALKAHQASSGCCADLCGRRTSIAGWRSQVLLASYDQGIFQQVLWNSLRGHPFESTLSSQLSTNVIHSGEPAGLGYARLGQHFTPSLLLWAPLFGLIGGAALPLVQVGLIVSAGLVLHRLALQLVPARTANWLTYGFYGGNALIGPTLGNFTDLCQLPLAVFALMLGLRGEWGG